VLKNEGGETSRTFMIVEEEYDKGKINDSEETKKKHT
jgi:hypothetical protein